MKCLISVFSLPHSPMYNLSIIAITQSFTMRLKSIYFSPSLPSIPNILHLAAGLLLNPLYVYTSILFHFQLIPFTTTRMVIIFTNWLKAVSQLHIELKKNKPVWTCEALNILPPASLSLSHFSYLLPKPQIHQPPFMSCMPKYVFTWSLICFCL